MTSLCPLSSTRRLVASVAIAACVLAGLPSQAADAKAPEAAATNPVLVLPLSRLKSKPDFAYASPDGSATLVVSADSTGGDFPQAPVYIRVGGKLYDLGAYRRVDKVKWARNGRSVTFEGAQLKDYGVSDVVAVTYTLGGKVLTRKVLRQEKDEPSG